MLYSMSIHSCVNQYNTLLGETRASSLKDWVWQKSDVHIFCFIQILFVSLDFELLKFEFKKKTIYKSIEDFNGIFL